MFITRNGKLCLVILLLLAGTICSLVLTQLTVNAIYQDDQFYTRNAWPKALALGIPGCFFLFMGYIQRNSKRVFMGVNFETGNEIFKEIDPPNRPAYALMAAWGTFLLAVAFIFLAT
jgi:hypothetical protein